MNTPSERPNLPLRLLTVGLVSGRPQVLKALCGVNFILHAGDIGSAALLEDGWSASLRTRGASG